ncbi:CPBP family intramembrane glutamic endopeptidase [Staphylococcus borealis]|uniref:CPBP family intramembrane glutamic endopeptidase n=1 Tax=Staphylococcus borealis TaxID=2742203 RepID=UPI000D1ED7F7|nr:type II CAAX endopeptidase family protein [Staphylococcus borealis]PTK68377.1 CPBP family intramembrane metalloprotease [Staphylococcus borealis]RIO72117.1 CPBP family intramembrane metalloprotease [Staphylococcus borealis]
MTFENEHAQEASKQAPFKNEFASKRIVKRDFWLIPGYLIINIVLPLILTIVTMIMIMAITGQTSEAPMMKQVMGINQIFVLLGQCLLLLLFYLMHRKSLIPLAIQRFKDLRKHIVLIVVVLIAMYLAQYIYGNLIELLPEKYQFSNTENNKQIEELFKTKWIWPVLFLDIVIVTPIVEELLFRHLIIHELGKKLTYGAMYVVSVVLFASLHVLSASSPFEIGPYLIMAIGFVIAYHYSGRNLATTITLHMINNLISYVTIIIPLIW